MTYSPQAAVAWAKTQLGFHEGPNNSNPYSVWQGLDNNNPWCASFQCQANYEGGYRFSDACTFGEKGEAYTPTEAERAKVEGLWRDKFWRALPGDAVLFDWGNNGLIDHVEVVVYDDGNRIITIGGNTSDSVAYRTRDRAYVAGFWALSQSPQAAPPLDLTALKKLAEWRNKVAAKPLHEGDHSNRVAILNQLLVALGWMVVPKNMNVYGRQTVAGVRHMKTALGFADKDGTKFGGPAADALLTPRHD